jgi:hypothetical protein
MIAADAKQAPSSETLACEPRMATLSRRTFIAKLRGGGVAGRRRAV